MNDRQQGSSSEGNSRAGTATIGGYVGFVFGMLFVVSMASELDALSLGESAAIVLIHMMVGYAVGWLVRPLLSALFPES